jgi:DNA polymerase III subunit epsilon
VCAGRRRDNWARRRATDHGTPVVDEARFLTLLDNVHPGTAKAIPKAAGRSKSRSAKPAPASTGPLTGRRILVLGGTHDAAAQARARIAELGGSSAVNMSGSVTDVLALTNAATDQRHTKAVELGLPIHGPELLHPGRTADPTPALAPTPGSVITAPISLSHGQVIDLPIADHGTEWTFRASWTQTTTCEVDLVAFLLDGEERVSDDDDFVFYNQPDALGAQLSAEGPNEQAVTLRLDALPEHCRRIVIAAAIDGDAITFGEVGAIELDATPGPEAATAARATLDAATTERTLRLAEIYLRGETWRLRSVGQGYDTGLAELAAGFGVQVDED